MSRRRLTRLCVATLAVAAIVPVQVVAAPAASAAAAPRIVYYDATRAAEFVSAVHQGAANWNNSVTSVRLERARAGTPVNVVVTADNGWPRASVRSLGNGRIWMGRTAVNQGHHPPRIAAHEFGHILGLPDRRTGLCADLMSGASGGTSCRNAFPNAREKRAVERNFGGVQAATAVAGEHVWDCSYRVHPAAAGRLP